MTGSVNRRDLRGEGSPAPPTPAASDKEEQGGDPEQAEQAAPSASVRGPCKWPGQALPAKPKGLATPSRHCSHSHLRCSEDGAAQTLKPAARRADLVLCSGLFRKGCVHTDSAELPSLLEEVQGRGFLSFWSQHFHGAGGGQGRGGTSAKLSRKF